MKLILTIVSVISFIGCSDETTVNTRTQLILESSGPDEALTLVNPVPAELAPAPALETELAPEPAPEMELAPAPAPEMELAPAPAPEMELAPAPAPETELAPAPAPETELAPAPAPETELAPAPAPETDDASGACLGWGDVYSHDIATTMTNTTNVEFCVDVPESECGNNAFYPGVSCTEMGYTIPIVNIVFDPHSNATAAGRFGAAPAEIGD